MEENEVNLKREGKTGVKSLGGKDNSTKNKRPIQKYLG